MEKADWCTRTAKADLCNDHICYPAFAFALVLREPRVMNFSNQTKLDIKFSLFLDYFWRTWCNKSETT